MGRHNFLHNVKIHINTYEKMQYNTLKRTKPFEGEGNAYS